MTDSFSTQHSSFNSHHSSLITHHSTVITHHSAHSTQHTAHSIHPFPSPPSPLSLLSHSPQASSPAAGQGSHKCPDSPAPDPLQSFPSPGSEKNREREQVRKRGKELSTCLVTKVLAQLLYIAACIQLYSATQQCAAQHSQQYTINQYSYSTVQLHHSRCTPVPTHAHSWQRRLLLRCTSTEPLQRIRTLPDGTPPLLARP